MVNNVIVNNGKSGPGGSPLGGISLSWQAAPLPTLYNNTIVSNYAATGKKAGVTCDTNLVAGYQLFNTVVWFNFPTGATPGCGFQYSIMSGLPSTLGNLSGNPNLDSGYRPISGLCIDKGTSTFGVTVLDHGSDPRPKVSNGQVDKGAFEVL